MKMIVARCFLFFVIFSTFSCNAKLNNETNFKNEDEVFKIVEEMPRFPGCEHILNEIERKNCASSKFLNYVHKNLKISKEDKILENFEHKSVAQFVVDKYGSIQNIKIIRGDSTILGNAFKKVLSSMNDMPEKWIPGKHHGKSVKVMISLPININIGNE